MEIWGRMLQCPTETMRELNGRTPRRAGTGCFWRPRHPQCVALPGSASMWLSWAHAPMPSSSAKPLRKVIWWAWMCQVCLPPTHTHTPRTIHWNRGDVMNINTLSIVWRKCPKNSESLWAEQPPQEVFPVKLIDVLYSEGHCFYFFPLLYACLSVFLHKMIFVIYQAKCTKILSYHPKSSSKVLDCIRAGV